MLGLFDVSKGKKKYMYIFTQSSSDRRLFSAGKLDHVYVSSYAPIRLDEAELARFDLCLAPFDADGDERAFHRAARIVLALRNRFPVLFCSAGKPSAMQLVRNTGVAFCLCLVLFCVKQEWCAARRISVLDASDAHLMRKEISEALSNHEKHRIVPTESDVQEEAQEAAAREKKRASKLQPARQRFVFSILMLVTVMLVLFWSSSVARASGLPVAAVNLLASLIGAYVVAKAFQKE